MGVDDWKKEKSKKHNGLYKSMVNNGLIFKFKNLNEDVFTDE